MKVVCHRWLWLAHAGQRSHTKKEGHRPATGVSHLPPASSSLASPLHAVSFKPPLLPATSFICFLALTPPFMLPVPKCPQLPHLAFCCSIHKLLWLWAKLRQETLVLEWTKSCCKLVDVHAVDNLLSSTQISKVSSAYWCLKHALEFGISCTSNVRVWALHQDRNTC